MSDQLPVWVPLLAPAAELAQTVAQTDFVPSAMRNKPAAVAACILTGHELGIGPMESLRSVHIIDGRASLAAELIRSRYLAAGHKLWTEELSTTRVVVAGHRGDDPGHITKVTWTMDDARKAGLANKQNWAKYPRQMLTARATAELCRLVAPDASGGLPSVEELEGERTDDSPAQAAEPAKTARRAQRAPIDATATQKALPAAQDAPEPEEPPLPPLPGEEDPPPEPGVELVSQKWIRGWFAKANETGIDDDTRHALVTYGTNGRTPHINQVRRDEANAVRDTLAQFADGQLALAYSDDGTITATLIESPEP